MEQADFVVGFSELKDLLINKYNIQTPREKIRLYFTVMDSSLFMHDYKNHTKSVMLSRNVLNGQAMDFLQGKPFKIIQLSLQSVNAPKLLNEYFLLSGYFTF